MEYIMTDYDSSMKYANKALILSKENEIKNEEATALNTIGGIYFYQGKYKESMLCYIETAKIWEKAGNKKELASSYNNIGNVYYYQANFDKAIEYYQLSINICRQINDLKGIAQGLYNVANIYQDQKENFKEAKKYMEQSLVLFEKINNKKGVAYALNGLGNIYDITEKYPESIKYYTKALTLFAEMDDKKGQAASLAALGTISQKLNQTQEALNYLNQGLIIAQEIGAMDMVMQIYQALAEVNYKMGKYKDAIDEYKLYNTLKDSMLNDVNIRQISEMEAKYNTNIKQQKIEKQNLELQKSNAEIKQQATQKYAFIIGFILMLVISFIIYYNYRNKQKINVVLTAQKKEIVDKNDELQSQNIEITKQRDEIDRNLKYTEKLQEALKHDLSHYMQLSLRKIINPHFIFNSLNSIQSFILQNEKLEASMYLSKFSDLMRKVLDQSQKEFISLKDEIETLDLYIELESKRFEGKFSWNINIDNNLNTDKVFVPPLIAQPFIENAIWHGLMHLENEGKLLVSVKGFDDFLAFTIEDNGIGREKSAQLNKNRKNRESHGIKITQERIKAINSLHDIDFSVNYTDLKDENGVGVGTRVEFYLPIQKMITDD
jgi:tetratricopeptide (TPR) repeat protein